MRLLVLSHLFPNPLQPTQGTFVFELVRHMAPTIYTDVISPVPWGPYLALTGKAPLRSIAQIQHTEQLGFAQVYHPHYLTLPSKLFLKYTDLLYSCGIRRDVRSLDYDLIHAHQPYPDGYVGLQLKQKTSKPLVVTIHGDVLIQRILSSSVLRSKVKRVLKYADAIIIVASYQRLFCEEMEIIDSEKVFHIPNGVDSELFCLPINKSEIRKKLELSDDKKLLVYVGHLYAPKCLQVLIDSIAQLCDQGFGHKFELILVGDGPLKKELESRCYQKGINSRVKFVGNKPHSKVPDWLKAADLFVLPSIQEGFPTVIPEALASGLPVVSTQVGGIPDIINSPEFGILVPPGDAAALAYAIKQAFAKKWNNQEIAKYGAKYDWKYIAQQTFEVYKSTLQSSIQ